MLKIFKYNILVFELVALLKMKANESRMAVILITALLLVHMFACVFYILCRLHDFDESTWVNNKGVLDVKGIDAYILTLYWAF